MSVATSKETLCINQMIGQKTDTAMVEEDFVVPDIKPDILNTIRTNGTVCIYKKEIMDGKIKLEGCINVYIMYLADDEESSIRSLNTTLEFSKTIDFDGAKTGMMLENKISLKSIECRVLNGRKVNIKAIMDVDLRVFSNENVEFVKEIEDVKDVQVLDKTLSLNTLLGTGMTKVYAKDTLVIDNIDNLEEIMKVDVRIINKETKISYNKVLVKADASVKIMYRTEDNRICTISNLIPIMGFIDMPDVTDESMCNVKFEIKNMLIKPNNIEEHSIYVEIELEITCNTYNKKELNIIEDLYSPTIDLIYKQKQLKTVEQKTMIKDICSIREKQVISEIGNNKIYDVEVNPTIINQKILTNKIMYEGEVELSFLYSFESRVETKKVVVPFTFNVDSLEVNAKSTVETSIEVALQDFTVMSDSNMDIKLDLEFNISLSNTQTINVIQEINIDENRECERYSLIIYFVKPGDTLWNIAKKFRSTVENIVTINGIEDENKINVGQQLFIPIAMCYSTKQ